MAGSLIGRLLSGAARRIGKVVDGLADEAGNIGASISYLTGRTGRLLKEGAEESVKKSGRVLSREEQAAGVFNRTVLRGEVQRERMTSAGSFFLQGRLATPREAPRIPLRVKPPKRLVGPLFPSPSVESPVTGFIGPLMPSPRFRPPFAVPKVGKLPTTSDYVRARAEGGTVLGYNFKRVKTKAGEGPGYEVSLEVKKGVADPRYAVNTTKYEKALASRSRARKFLFGRMLPAAGIITGGYIGGAVMRNITEERKAYYGEEMYASRYGDVGETAAGLIETAGLVFGGGAALGITPISGAARFGKKVFGKRGLITGARIGIRGFVRHGGSKILAIPSKIRASISGRTARENFLDRFKPHMTGTGRPPKRRREVKSQRRSRQQERLARETEQAARKERLARDGYDENLNRLPERKKRAEKSYKKAIKLKNANQDFLGPITKMAVLTGTAGLAGSLVLGQEPTLLAAGAATSLAIKSAGFIKRHPAGVALTAATFASGAAIGMNITPSPAAEGNIEEVIPARQSAIRRLNYSTAGLVQSIHNNRRM